MSKGKFENIEVKGIVTTLSPVSHGRIPKSGEKDAGGENNVLRFRKLPFMISKKPDEKPVLKEIYCVSGNALRGIGRMLLYRHTYEDVLDLNFDEILPIDKDFNEIRRRLLISTLQSGGATPSGSKIQGNVPVGKYDQILDELPTLDLLGGVYVAHHFNSSASIGNLIIRSKETAQFYSQKYNVFETTDEPLPSIDEISVMTMRHTRCENSKDASEFPFQDGDIKNDENKAKAIYGTEVLPVGTEFYWRNLLHTDREGTKLAFRAMLALIKRRGCIGGMNSKGYGHVAIEFDENLDHAIDEYDAYLLAHKDEIIHGIQLLGTDFKFTLKSDAGKAAKKKGENDA